MPSSLVALSKAAEEISLDTLDNRSCSVMYSLRRPSSANRLHGNAAAFAE
ncbi:MAG: hypothetical protein U0892_15030 [Pirellulales bacterium]